MMSLQRHKQRIEEKNLAQMFADNPKRSEQLTFAAAGWHLDLSRNLIDEDCLTSLCNHLQTRDFEHWRRAMFCGERINHTENRAVLHVALRAPRDEKILLIGENVVDQVWQVKDAMSAFAEGIRDGKIKGQTGKQIRHIVNIGIGGSDLGPVMVYEALKQYKHPDLQCHFVSNIDGFHLEQVLNGVPPEETLFIVVSKTFTTQETMTNAQSARNWLVEQLGEKAVKAHFCAVSTNLKGVQDFGIDESRTFGFWDWVGGRYSLTSAVGLSLMISLGPQHFEALLRGFWSMDQHFANAPIAKNLPALMGLMAFWYIQFWGRQSIAVLPYAEPLTRFPAYLQQADMESLGKQTDRDGKSVDYPTGCVIWGEPGTNGQHAFYQLIHQGTGFLPCEFIGFAQANSHLQHHHEILMAHFFAQQQALAFGKSLQQVLQEGCDPEIAPYRVFPGNRPSSMLLAAKLDPFHLGSLISLYEHRIFVLSMLWNINAFDQWGVELGKSCAKPILNAIRGGEHAKLDPATINGLSLLKQLG